METIKQKQQRMLKLIAHMQLYLLNSGHYDAFRQHAMKHADLTLDELDKAIRCKLAETQQDL